MISGSKDILSPTDARIALQLLQYYKHLQSRIFASNLLLVSAWRVIILFYRNWNLQGKVGFDIKKDKEQ